MADLLVTSFYYLLGLLGIALLGTVAAVYFSSQKVNRLMKETISEENTASYAQNQPYQE